MPRVLLTGATGFAGSHLLRLLLRRGCEVAILMRSSADPWRIRDVLAQVRVIQGDLASLQNVADAIGSFAPQWTAHLAWHGVGPELRNDLSQLTNLGAILSLLAAVGAAGCEQFVGLGSQAEYGPHHAMIDESTATTPSTVYGVTKLAAGLTAQQYCASHGMRLAWLRLFSSYGPGDSPRWMIPDVILTLLRGGKPSLTAGQQEWDFLYVEDAVEAIYLAMEKNAEGIFNLASGECRPLRQIVEQVRDLVDPSLPLGFGEIPYRPDQVMRLEADIRRLRSHTGWSPRTSLQDGLRATVDWYRENSRRVP